MALLVPVNFSDRDRINFDIWRILILQVNWHAHTYRHTRKHPEWMHLSLLCLKITWTCVCHVLQPWPGMLIFDIYFYVWHPLIVICNQQWRQKSHREKCSKMLIWCTVYMNITATALRWRKVCKTFDTFIIWIHFPNMVYITVASGGEVREWHAADTILVLLSWFFHVGQRTK